MTQKTFIETYKIDVEVCDKIIGLYNLNQKMAQPGRLGENPRIDKNMKDSMDITIPIKTFAARNMVHGLVMHLLGILRLFLWLRLLRNAKNLIRIHFLRCIAC